jgi:hypothetical protein
VASARDPASADGEDLPDEAIRGVRAEVGRELRVLARRHQAAERHLALDALLESLGLMVNPVTRELLPMRLVLPRVG